jgi:hypothetical protein
VSSTSAVSVLAQGLRDLRDFAEGPDGEELRERTGLTAEQIDTALEGDRLPTREVTLTLVEAWEGDIEAWQEYWGQIAALAEEDEGQGAGSTPAPPEPSIITPMVVEGEEAAAESAGAQGEILKPAEADEPGDPEQEQEQEEAEAEHEADDSEAEAMRARSAARAQLEANAQAAKAQSEAMAAAEAAAQTQDAQTQDAQTQDTEAQDTQTQDTAEQTEAEPAEPHVTPRVQPGSGSPELKPVILARAEETPEETPEEATEAPQTLAEEAPEPKSAKRGLLARIGIPILVFAIGVGVGAFGDHALNSKQTSTRTAASVPPVSTTSRPSHTVALSPSGSGVASSPSSTPSSAASNPAGSTSLAGTSPSGTSTVVPGTVLGAYVGIQLASGYSVNFLADPYHPAAGTANGPDTMGFFAGSFVDGRFYADRVAILDATDTGSFTSCLNDTRYQHDVLLSQISTATSFCITTGTGHLVLVTVRRLPSSTDANPYAVLDVTVWQGS